MSQYPRIWDRSGERVIVGETKVSWVVRTNESAPADWESLRRDNPRWFGCCFSLVNKKTPNKNDYHPQWFFDEQSHLDTMFAVRNKYEISRMVERAEPSMLRQIADLIGYEEKL